MATKKKLLLALIIIIGSTLSGLAVSTVSAQESDDNSSDKVRAEKRIDNLESAFKNEFPWCAYSDSEKSAFSVAKGMFANGEYSAAMQTLNKNYPASQARKNRGVGPGRFLASQKKSRPQDEMKPCDGQHECERNMDGPHRNQGGGGPDRRDMMHRRGGPENGGGPEGQKGMRGGLNSEKGPWRNNTFDGWENRQNNQGIFSNQSRQDRGSGGQDGMQSRGGPDQRRGQRGPDGMRRGPGGDRGKKEGGKVKHRSERCCCERGGGPSRGITGGQQGNFGGGENGMRPQGRFGQGEGQRGQNGMRGNSNRPGGPWNTNSFQGYGSQQNNQGNSWNPPRRGGGPGGQQGRRGPGHKRGGPKGGKGKKGPKGPGGKRGGGCRK